jgi:flagella basal body P-ring formation protein FlgA
MVIAGFRQAVLCFMAMALAFLYADISLAEEVRVLPVPSITIYPGDIIRDSWLVDRDFVTNPLSSRDGVIDSHQALVGKIARRTLLPGTPIQATAVTEPRLISSGAKVKVIYSEGGMTISTYGSALQNGGAGDIVSIRNLDSGLTISGVVQPDGSVRVSGG